MRMPRKVYQKIVVQLNSIKPSVRDVTDIIQQYKGLSTQTLCSIRSQEYQKKMKKNHHLHYNQEAQELYYRRYIEGVSKGHQHVILNMAEEIDLSPALLARIILEKYMSVSTKEGDNTSRGYITQLMKEPSLLDDPILATEISQCVYSDDFYGPVTDSIKHSVGYEYEFKLKRELEKLGHSFIGEEQMRLKGYDKTPDVKLEIPIAVDGCVVNWIESKALFGDDLNHKAYLRDQFWSYWNRFGPGMVIYWLGFIEELDVHQDKGILLRHEFPKDIVTLNPLG